MIISIVSLVFLLGLVVYLLMLIINSSRITSISQSTAELEAKVLEAKIKSIGIQSEFESNQEKLSWNGFRKFTLVKKIKETKDITSFYLAPHDGNELPGFMPGQYLTFQLNIPGQVKPVIRCYSLSDSPYHPDRYRVSIKRVLAPRDTSFPPGLGSNYFHDSLNENDIIDVKAPSGHFYLDMTKSTPVVLLAGGVGITPMLSMLNAIIEMGSKREVWFFLGVRDKTEHVMQEHLDIVAGENENVNLRIFYSKPAETDVFNKDYHVKGRVNVENFKSILPSNNFDFYMCAPPPMVKDLRNDLADWGVPKKNIHFEAFGPATVKVCKKESDKESDSKISVQFKKSGKNLMWDSQASSLLDFAEANQIPIDSGCRAGNCGTCLIAIKSGDIELVGEPGSEPEAGSCLACISVPKDNISLDA
ncbi:MAG: 2Fe-2S iron-sulfur cluster binding domain-containing protein [Nitrospina sp.]|nr:2Fe-2S iron-sulfur cluster binding domain-containing protein [Nitrospina sp.]